METPEEIKTINQRLIDYFGKFENGEANFRVVWSDDLTEKRLMEITDTGIQLLHPEMREVKKYWYCLHRYVLERLTVVPYQQEKEIANKLSYEPLWVFEDGSGSALPPKWEVINILIKTLQDQMLYKKGPYKLPEGEGNTAEEIHHRAKMLEEVLYGNETPVGDALATGSGVGYGQSSEHDVRSRNNPIKIH